MKRILALAALAACLTGQTRINGSRTLEGTFNYCADAGGTDAYACSLSPAITAYTSGACYHFKANTVNTGAASIALNGLSALTIKKPVATTFADLADADIRAGQIITVCYDGTNAVMMSMLGNQGKQYGAQFDGGGSAITDGSSSIIQVPTGCTIGQATIATNDGTARNIAVSVWADSTGSFPPTIADIISASAPMTLSAAQVAEDTTLTGWTTAVPAGHWLKFVVLASPTPTAQTATVLLRCR